MRHGKKFNHLGRKAGHRKALMKNMAISLITHKRITTTVAKAKALRTFIEPLITKSKSNTTHSRRVVFSYLQNKDAVKQLFDVIAGKVGDRPGGYVRIIKTGFRRSDGSEMAMIELVDFNEVYTNKSTAAKSGKKSRTRRGRRKSSNKAAAPAVTETIVEDSEDAVVSDEEE